MSQPGGFAGEGGEEPGGGPWPPPVAERGVAGPPVPHVDQAGWQQVLPGADALGVVTGAVRHDFPPDRKLRELPLEVAEWARLQVRNHSDRLRSQAVIIRVRN